MRKGRNENGQVLIEVMLMLPVFLLLVFTIMEIGHLAFRTILLHHAAYEVARIGSLTSAGSTASKTCGSPNVDDSVMNGVLQKMLPQAQGDYVPEAGLTDPQDCCTNYDLKVTLVDEVKYIFPMTGVLLANAGCGSASVCKLTAAVRMPIERPLFGGKSC